MRTHTSYLTQMALRSRVVLVGVLLVSGCSSDVGFSQDSERVSTHSVSTPFVDAASPSPSPSPSPSVSEQTGVDTRTDSRSPALRLVAAARSQVGVTVGYDPAYVGLAYPGGDVPIESGVCTDVVVRALRQLGIDLQVRIHQDMKANFSKYPSKWQLKTPDKNIDHRRVPNIATYFVRRGYELPVSDTPQDYLPGDIVWIKLPLDHTGIVSDRTKDGRPLLIHNVGRGTQEEDVLFSWDIVGHYRVLP